MTLSNKTKRITLLMYMKTIPMTNAAMMTAAISPARSAMSTPGKCGNGERGEAPGWWGKLKFDLLKPLEPSSPASSPTTARRTHCPKRKGWKSCFLVCSKASEMESTAEIGKAHLGLRMSQQGTANFGRDQTNSKSGTGAGRLTPQTDRVGDPSLRRKNGSAQDDAVVPLPAF